MLESQTHEREREREKMWFVDKEKGMRERRLERDWKIRKNYFRESRALLI